MRPGKRLLRQCGVPVGTTVLAFLATLLVAPLSERFPFALFIAATLISAFHRGLTPALLATSLSAVFILLHQSILMGISSLGDPDFLARLGIFVLVGLLAGYISRVCKQTIDWATRIHETLSNSGAAVVCTDGEGRVTFLNPLAESLTGWQRGEVVGKLKGTICHAVDERDSQPLEKIVRQLLREASSVAVGGAAMMLGRDGTERPIEYRVERLRDARDRTKGVLLIFRDVTREVAARKKAEQDVADLNERANAWRDQHQQRETALQERSAELTKANNALQEQLSAERRLLAELRRQHECFQAERQGLEEEMRQLGQRHESDRRQAEQEQAEWQRKREEWQRQHAALEEARREAGAARDRLRQELSSLRSIAVHLADPVYAIDRRGQLTFMNPAAEQLLGWTEAELLGKDIHEKIHVPEANGLPVGTGDGRLVLQSSSVSRHDEVSFRRKDGTIIGTACTVSPIVHKGHVEGAVISVQDSALRRREEQLRAQLSELAETVRRRDQFLDRLVEELSGPLPPLRDAARLIRARAGRDGTLPGAIETLQRQCQRLTLLANGLADVRRLARGDLHLHREPVDVSRFVSRILDGAEWLMQPRQQRLTVSLPPQSLRLIADPVRLEQVLLHLLHNAAKHSPPGGHMVLSAARELQDVVFRIRDHGVGIPADRLESVFNPAPEKTRSHHAIEPGLGIGLPLVRGLVELHGGSVEASSAGPGQGSEFRVRLPALPDAPLAEVEAPLELPQRLQQPTPIEPLRGAPPDWLAFN